MTANVRHKHLRALRTETLAGLNFNEDFTEVTSQPIDPVRHYDVAKSTPVLKNNSLNT